MKNNNSGLKELIIIVVVLLLVILGLVVYKEYFYNKKDKTDNNKEVEKTEEKKVEILSNNGSEVKEAMESLEKIKIVEENAYKGNFTIKDISDYELLDTAFSNMLSEGTIKSACDFEPSEGITTEEINLKLKSIFNSNYNIKMDAILKNSEESEPGSNIRVLGVYNLEIRDDVIYVNAPCDVDGGFRFINRNIAKVEKEDNKLYIYSTIAFGLYDFDIVEYYDNFERTNEKEVLKITDYEGVDITRIPPKWELYKTYKYTFNIINSKYFIDAIEIVK